MAAERNNASFLFGRGGAERSSHARGVAEGRCGSRRGGGRRLSAGELTVRGVVGGGDASGRLSAGSRMGDKREDRIRRRMGTARLRSVYGRRTGFGGADDGIASRVSRGAVSAGFSKSGQKYDDGICSVFAGGKSVVFAAGAVRICGEGKIMGKRSLRKESMRRGSYTVEAALLMGILIPLLAAVIYMGFFLHDRAFLQAAAAEAAVGASLAADENTGQSAGAAQRLAAGRMLGVRNLSGNLLAGEKEAQVFYEGDFLIPGLIVRFFGKGSIQIRTQAALGIERPSKRIQKIRSAVKIIDVIRGKSD